MFPSDRRIIESVVIDGSLKYEDILVYNAITRLYTREVESYKNSFDENECNEEDYKMNDIYIEITSIKRELESFVQFKKEIDIIKSLNNILKTKVNVDLCDDYFEGAASEPLLCWGRFTNKQTKTDYIVVLSEPILLDSCALLIENRKDKPNE